MNKNSLIETYSRAAGVKIDKPFIYQTPYPLLPEKYIVVYTGSGNANKNYSYWQEVFNFLIKSLEEENIKIIQLGGADDQIIAGANHLQGRTTINQSAYIIKNSLLVCGNDSMLGHVAGALDVPSVLLYGPTSSVQHGPYWKNSQTVLIDSHRNGKLPSFHFNENPKTIDFIKHEEVIEAIVSILNLNFKDKITTLHIGEKFNQRCLDVVPDCVVNAESFKEIILNIRYDYLQNQENLVNQLSLRKCIITTNKPLDANLLAALKHNIAVINYEIDENHNVDFVNFANKLGIKTNLYSYLPQDKLSKIKLDYLSVDIIHEITHKTKQEIKDFENINSNCWFKTYKLLLSNGKFYSSKAHWALDIPRDDMLNSTENVIESPKFYEDSDYYLIFKKE
jgi:hypothetical protein